ncbi:MAG TPA: hypothetical protein VFD38_09775 [Myxococcaceae bacterium]|nr:hypothetical protein [Myxococcaceae bacterium]
MLRVLLLFALSQPDDASVRRTAILGVDGCEAPLARSRVAQVRDQLAPRLRGGLISEADTAARLGGLPGRTLPELRRALDGAREAFYGGRTQRAVQELDRVQEEALRLLPSDERWVLLRDAMATRALVTMKSDPSATDRTLRRLVAVDAGFEPDPAEYPPSYRKAVDSVRAAVKGTGTNRLDVRVDPPGTAVFVAGRPVGKAPVSVQMPPGDYLVEAAFSRRGMGRVVTVPRPGDPPNTVALSAGLEGAVAPGAGPCIAAKGARPELLSRTFELLGVERLLLLRAEQTSSGPYLVLTEWDPRTRSERGELRASIPSPSLQDLAAKELASRVQP